MMLCSVLEKSNNNLGALFKQNPSKVRTFFFVNTWFLNPNTVTHRIHGTGNYIYLHEWLIFMVN